MGSISLEKIILALDVESFNEAEKFVKLLKQTVGVFKVGKQLFTLCGPKVVEMIQQHGGKVFLDLKFHDIPHTVARAVEEAVYAVLDAGYRTADLASSGQEAVPTQKMGDLVVEALMR